jgi:hypothetical protein
MHNNLDLIQLPFLYHINSFLHEADHNPRPFSLSLESSAEALHILPTTGQAIEMKA